LHVTLAAGLTLCVVAFIIELGRGVHGHWGAWVYVVEWPVFAVFGTFIWWRLLHSDERPLKRAPEAAAAPKPATTTEASDPELDAWQAYVERLHKSEEGRPDESGRPT
jgi:hypothetical protein